MFVCSVLLGSYLRPSGPNKTASGINMPPFAFGFSESRFELQGFDFGPVAEVCIFIGRLGCV